MGWAAAVGRRGTTTTEPVPPPGGEVFGPLLGRADVIAKAKPLTVIDPGGGVPFDTWAELASAITANGAGTTFVKRGASALGTISALQVGSKAPKIWFPGLAGVTSTITIDANGQNIMGITGTQTGAPVEIHGGRWTNFGDTGGLDHHGPMVMRDNWLLEDFVTDNNWNAGFLNQGSNVIVRRGTTHHNGQNAWRQTEFTIDGPKRENNLYQRIETHSNNTRNLGPGGFAGGVKMLQSRNCTGRYIYCHDEDGFGLWFDTAEGGTEHPGNGFEECVVENTARSGLFLEGVGSGAFLRNNWVTDCGRDITIGTQAAQFNNCAAVRVATADMTLGGTTRGDISFNRIDFTLPQSSTLGVLLVLSNHDGHGDRCRNWDVHNNQLWLRSTTTQSNGRVGANDSATTGLMMVQGDIDFYDNEYHVASNTVQNWQWFLPGTRSEDLMTYGEWQGVQTGDDLPRQGL